MGDGTRQAPPRKRRYDGALANKRAADQYARMTAPIIRRLRASGIVSQRCLADALNQHHVATARGGKWHRTSVKRLLARLSGLASHKMVGWGPWVVFASHLA
jgi:hypothetical protein